MKKLKIDGNSTENQRIKDYFVRREVLTCSSYEIEAVLMAEKGSEDYPLPSYDDIENYYEWKCCNCGAGYQTQEEAKSCCDKDIEQEPQEILEWWIVTEYLYNKLKEKGQPVLEWGNNCYWGRTCSGQAISLDGVITVICKDMEILEGQANEWKL